MKKLLFGAMALAGVAMSIPANAQGIYFGFGDGPRYERPYGYYDGYRPYRRHHHYYGAYARDYRECRVVRIWVGDHYRRIRRCY